MSRPLRGVDLAIAAGEVVALLGPNGAGKTTSISLMLGLRQPTSGEARLFGLSPSDRRARSRAASCSRSRASPRCSGSPRSSTCSGATTPPRCPPAGASRCPASPTRRASFTGRLSGGERQRLYFALAVCGDPEALFLDEPSVGMDVTARRGMVETIRAFAAAGKTIVLTTHYLDEADQLARRIVVIDHGVVIADASPPQIKARVASKRVSFSTTPPLTDDVLRTLPARLLERDGARVRLLSREPERLLRAVRAGRARARAGGGRRGSRGGVHQPHEAAVSDAGGGGAAVAGLLLRQTLAEIRSGGASRRSAPSTSRCRSCSTSSSVCRWPSARSPTGAASGRTCSPPSAPTRSAA